MRMMKTEKTEWTGKRPEPEHEVSSNERVREKLWTRSVQSKRSPTTPTTYFLPPENEPFLTLNTRARVVSELFQRSSPSRVASGVRRALAGRRLPIARGAGRRVPVEWVEAK